MFGTVLSDFAVRLAGTKYASAILFRNNREVYNITYLYIPLNLPYLEGKFIYILNVLFFNIKAVIYSLYLLEPNFQTV